MSAITTHVLDTSIGRPASNVAVLLRRRGSASGEWNELARGATDGDGRLRCLEAEGALEAGMYQLSFDTAAYFSQQGREAFYPEVAITWTVLVGTEHYHVPLLLSPFGYSTYRGS